MTTPMHAAQLAAYKAQGQPAEEQAKAIVLAYLGALIPSGNWTLQDAATEALGSDNRAQSVVDAVLRAMERDVSGWEER